MFKDYKIVGLCISRANDHRHLKFINGLNDKLVEAGARLFIYQTCSDLFWDTKNELGEKSIFELIDYDILDALIFFDEDFYDKNVGTKVCAEATKRNIPVITIGDRIIEGVNYKFDYSKGFEEVVRHVVDFHGKRNIFFIAGNRNNKLSDDRIEVFKNVMREKDPEFEVENIGYGDYWEEPTRDAVLKVIESGRIPEAFVCANDIMAVTTSVVLQKHGYRVPEDVIVVGFDGIDEARWNIPSITTCGCSFGKMVDSIIDTIHKMRENEPVRKEYAVPFELIHGASCGCGKNDYVVNTGDLLREQSDRLFAYQENERTLNAVSAEMISCDRIEDFIVGLGRFHFTELVIAVNKDCLEENINPISNERKQPFDDEMVRIFASDSAISGTRLNFDRKKVFPGIGAALVKAYPIVFSALSFVGVPFGFAAFYFEPKLNNYVTIAQTVTLLNNTISSYRNMRYLKFTAKAMEEIYRYDHLTGLYNRNAFYKELPGIINEASLSIGARIMVATIDINGLKFINDNFGHKQGDNAISIVADAIKNASMLNKLSARFGGDEFVICAVSFTPEADEYVLRKDIKRYLDAAWNSFNDIYEIGASIGVAFGVCEDFDFDTVFKEADKAMYKEKILSKHSRRSEVEKIPDDAPDNDQNKKRDI
ncbi:MAG: GGDEF domain-containing protein [Lachnospiraceae bacterium]|nr:GGDEF domain-containing protein [Lachnospiraceae bacterium]